MGFTNCLNRCLNNLLVSSESGHLEFWDTGTLTQMNSADHQQATDLEWDPTGRYVVTSVSVWKQKVKTKLFIFRNTLV